ncbi:radical SAM protein [Elizabethkingia argentiflava]|uniref:Radical SAM protein n=1 Tax=Elizabethkingia argenteiflava TaxID=2681556 RepID=A0A845PYT4_9FLAO|nr:radical SAM protein [Elizabethkingia argenteiflava]NAW51607.1 radical SAM protein [Elizabethkingia argenteiflava]
MKCQSLILKVASRCNLNCTYCYVYNQDDKSYIIQPKFMSGEIVDAVINKVYNHCRDNHIEEFLFVFHGGEPLLLKPAFYNTFVEKCNLKFKNKIKIHYTIQTNATLLNDEWCLLFKELKIQIGISIDGTKKYNDKFRLYKNGKSSFPDVITGIKNAFNYKYHKESLGLLCVINPTMDPLELYSFIKTMGVKNIDFLFPYVTHDQELKNLETEYSDWLINIFNEWYKDNNKINIRMFNGFISSLFGEEYPTDLFGNFENGLLVIETNGEIEPVDYLKVCGEKFTKTGLNILKHEISMVSDSKLINFYYHSHKKLTHKCNQCIIKEICGGGNLAARYSKKNGFDNSSVFCKDFLKLILHIQNVVFSEIPKEILKKENIEIINYFNYVKKIENFHNNIENEFLKSFAI